MFRNNLNDLPVVILSCLIEIFCIKIEEKSSMYAVILLVSLPLYHLVEWRKLGKKFKVHFQKSFVVKIFFIIKKSKWIDFI